MSELIFFSSTELSAASFKELLPYFFEELREDFEFLNTALNSKDLKNMRRLAHKIKGSAASYAATIVSNKARILLEHLDSDTNEDYKDYVLDLHESINETYEFAKKEFEID